jgi:Ca2+-transporting ATPase
MFINDPEGLSQQEAAERLASEGANELPSPDRRTPWKIIIGVITEPMFSFLVIAGIIYLILGDIQESVVLVGFVTLSISITVIQEIRSERVLEALRDLTSPRALVIRDGQPVRIAGREVVRGDLLIIKEGDRVPADAVLLSGDTVRTDESLLTGEAVAVQKKPTLDVTEMPAALGGDNLPFIYAGTLIVGGQGRALVLATGLRSQIGKIGQSLSAIETQQPRLREQTRHIVKVFAIGAVLLSVGFILVNGLLHGNWLSSFLGGVAIGMSLLPEEFPLVLAVFMVMGAWRISKAQVLTRRAAAIETLGAITVLCTDKTGTLTQNKMSIVQIQSGESQWQVTPETSVPAPFLDIIQIGALASVKESYDPMDMAFLNLTPRPEAPPPLRHYSLSADLLVMANVYEQDGHYLVAAKGAPEAIAKICRLDAAQTQKLHAAVNAMAEQGMRVLGIARASLTTEDFPETVMGFSFEWMGLVGFADPLRPAVPDAVREAQTAGIRVIMITGDYPKTAKVIAEQAGLTAGTVVTGDDLAKMSDDSLKDILKQAVIFARILPEQKLRIVNVLKESGEIVAMTGDGVNDAPSLKAAHIGIAMGSRGTDVAREASAIVLLEDDFSSLIKTIRLGRRIYANLKKTFLYIMAIHVPLAGLAMLPLFLGKHMILTPLLIAFIEMVIDPTCSIVFEAEEEEDNIMQVPPRNPKASILSAETLGLGFIQGILAFLMVGGFALYAFHQNRPEDEIRSLVFVALMVVNMALTLANRSDSPSFIKAFQRPNPFLWKGLLGITGIFSVVLLWPPAQKLFHFGALSLQDVTLTALAGGVLLGSLELVKKRWHHKEKTSATCL